MTKRENNNNNEFFHTWNQCSPLLLILNGFILTSTICYIHSHLCWKDQPLEMNIRFCVLCRRWKIHCSWHSTDNTPTHTLFLKKILTWKHVVSVYQILPETATEQPPRGNPVVLLKNERYDNWIIKLSLASIQYHSFHSNRPQKLIPKHK